LTRKQTTKKPAGKYPITINLSPLMHLMTYKTKPA